MKFFRLALVCSAASLCVLHAQDDDQQQQKAPTEIPDFNNLDEYIYVPKSNLNYGFRYSTGVRAHFGGNSTIKAPEGPLDESPNATRVYHDGNVGSDQRSTIVDNGNGLNASLLNSAADGKTNSWSYTSQGQLNPDGSTTPDGFLRFHIYSDTTDDSGTHDKTGKGNLGMEVYSAHDMRRLTKHWEWKIFGGMAVNDIQASAMTTVKSNLSTITDTYDLYGVTPPSAPYQSPSSSSINVTDANGNTVTDSSGNPITSAVDSSVLISAAPIASSVGTSTDTTSALEQFKLHGAYVTFRFGPQLMYDFNDHLKLTLSAGPVLIFAGSTYQVNAVLTPPAGAQIVDTVTNTTNRLLPGYYVDATLQYDLTDRTGFYLGAFDQSAGGYLQTASSPNGGAYTTKVDFDNQNGIRTGLSYKF